MKIVALLTISLVAIACSEHKVINVPKYWLDMGKPCVQKVRDQVTEQLKASMQHMAMGAHFSKDNINRPGFAKLFFSATSEKRNHVFDIVFN
ncbi:hypothetical protein GWI33_005891 [Rhynchophorus ferrugineus]|uniref:Ferritin-like diiron domain-containing protein n=1 Tax=Rhynchophorus ferrugineus TaxID=354439 RepID=A0A834IW04_RHYFE|nr:hypothetical protein GWI33_005891 [Rhynchophorus ferrugineus]